MDAILCEIKYFSESSELNNDSLADNKGSTLIIFNSNLIQIKKNDEEIEQKNNLKKIIKIKPAIGVRNNIKLKKNFSNKCFQNILLISLKSLIEYFMIDNQIFLFKLDFNL